ncbi:MAG: hypothetical protein R3335_06425, partial [Anaerolineales bacterium]|nr:hypothetical protein [Anaerolineales bacterium]
MDQGKPILSICISEALYSLFLKVYPGSFRRAFGSQMLQQFRDIRRDTGQARAWRIALPDLI